MYMYIYIYIIIIIIEEVSVSQVISLGKRDFVKVQKTDSSRVTFRAHSVFKETWKPNL